MPVRHSKLDTCYFTSGIKEYFESYYNKVRRLDKEEDWDEANDTTLFHYHCREENSFRDKARVTATLLYLCMNEPQWLLNTYKYADLNNKLSCVEAVYEIMAEEDYLDKIAEVYAPSEYEEIQALDKDTGEYDRAASDLEDELIFKKLGVIFKY